MKETILTIIRVSDLIKSISESEFIRLTQKEKEKILTQEIRDQYATVPGEITIKFEGEYVTIGFIPQFLSEEDKQLFSRALNLLIEKKYNIGREYLEKLLDKYPRNSEILYNLGMVFSETGEYEKSLEYLHSAVEYSPFFSNGYTALGFSYSQLKMYDKAIKYTEMAIKYNENSFYAYRNLGGLYAHKKDFESAEKFAKKAYELNDADPQVLLLMGMVSKAKGNISEADKYFRKIISNGIGEEFIKVAKNELVEIAAEEFRSKGALRPDAVMYLISALKLFNKMPKDEIKKIAFAAGIMGMSGFDVNNPDKKYYFKELNKECTGLQMVCYMYAGFKEVDPSMNVGFNLDAEYSEAKKMVADGIV